MYQSYDLKKLIKDSKELVVLYVEDNLEVRERILALLKLIFTDIKIADNGVEALHIFNNNLIDLIITDISMPKMNGITLIENIRKKNYSIPILVISAHSEQQLMIDVIKAGIDGFIFKPLDNEHFLNSIKKGIEKAILIKEHNKNVIVLKQYQEITNKSSIISKSDVNGIITYANKKFCEISGYSEEELVGQKHSIIRHPDNPKELYTKLWNKIKKEKKAWKGIIRNITKDGKSYFVKTTIQPLLDQDGEIIEFMALRDDITEIMSEKKQLLASIESYSLPLIALIQIENFDILDKFYDAKSVERIESTFGNTLIELFPKSDTIFEKIYALGAGLFAVNAEYKDLIKKNINIEKIFRTLIQNTKDSTICLGSIEYDISIAVSYCYSKNNTFENARHGIEKAINENRHLIFANDLMNEAQKTAQNNIETIHMVKKALDTSNIVSHFQPIINNKTKKIIKYESLVRLINEKGEIISPYFFLDVSKKGTYYTKITQRVIESSFKVLDHIKDNVSINLSVLDIENEQIRNKLIKLVSNQKYKGRVTFELLEDENIKDFVTVKDFITLVKDVGHVKIAIDDFGSGYSNFERLLDYAPDILKIDGSLIKNIETDIFSKNLVETIVTFAKKQNIETIAEYVENENIYNILTEMGVDYSQGFYFGKPEKII